MDGAQLICAAQNYFVILLKNIGYAAQSLDTYTHFDNRQMPPEPLSPLDS